MKKRICCGILAISAFVFASCAKDTVSDRIEANPEMFANLPAWEKPKVAQGQIAMGMSPEAVKIAWGNPNDIASGENKGKFTQRWTYSTFEQINTMPPMYPAWGGYYGGRYYRNYYYTPAMYYPTEYIPINTAYVLFENGKVVAWEQKN